MQIFNSLDQVNISEKTAVALGNFDGIHIGHFEILKAAVDVAKAGELKSVCYTFSNHPFNFIMGRNEEDDDALKLICSEEDKIKLIEDMGFDYLVNVPFDEATMKIRAHDFFHDIVVDKLNAAVVSIGFNYSYGMRAEGKADDLIRDAASCGIEAYVHDAVMYQDKVVSSTLIRELIKEGKLELAAELLGRSLSYSGRCEHGKTVGSKNGIPTINLVLGKERILPPFGVYAANTIVDGISYKSIVNIGTQPTFGNNEVRIESHLFDYSGDAYDKEVIVELLSFIREEKKFDSKEELYEQIRKDCEVIR